MPASLYKCLEVAAVTIGAASGVLLAIEGRYIRWEASPKYYDSINGPDDYYVGQDFVILHRGVSAPKSVPIVLRTPTPQRRVCKPPGAPKRVLAFKEDDGR